jgi:uncharacterized protein with HEPN domain
VSISLKLIYTKVLSTTPAARLMEIGEAVKNIDSALLDQRPEVEWKQIARMRDVLVHHYHDTDFAVVEAVIVERLPPLREAVAELKRIDASTA